jgi:L-asparaginase
LNLLQAVQVALSPVARGYGVLVVMDGQIHGAQRVTKISTQGVSAFASPGSGPLGWVDDHGVHLHAVPESRPKLFAQLQLPKHWPGVAIVYGCVDPSVDGITALLGAGVQGLVFTGTGAGQLSEKERSALEAWNGPLPLMLRSNRCGSGPVYGDADQAQFGLLPAGCLNPQKARVLLILALIAGLDQPGLASLCEAA